MGLPLSPPHEPIASGAACADMLLACCWAAALAVLAGASRADETWQSSVLTLTESSFDEAVKGAEVLLVEFYGARRLAASFQSSVSCSRVPILC